MALSIVLEIVFYFILFLFCLFLLAKDDFVLFRRNISVDRIFNIAMLTGVAALFSARLGYVAFNFSKAYLQPLVFLIFPYYSGLFLSSALIGGVLFLSYYTFIKKITLGRLLDMYVLAAFCSIASGMLFHIAVQRLPFVPHLSGSILFFASFVLLFKMFKKDVLHEGSIGLLGLVFFSLLYEIFQIVLRTLTKKPFFAWEDILLLGLFIGSMVFLVKKEKGKLKIGIKRK